MKGVCCPANGDVSTGGDHAVQENRQEILSQQRIVASGAGHAIRLNPSPQLM